MLTPSYSEYQTLLTAFIIVIRRQIKGGHVPTCQELDSLADDFRAIYEGRKEAEVPITVGNVIERLNFIHAWS
jgi:hypothetical protein